MIYEKIIYVEKPLLDQINAYLQIEPKSEEDSLGEDFTFSKTVVFENGVEADIKCCGVQYEEGGYNCAWSEAVLFNKAGQQISFSEPCDTFAGTWELEYKRDKYIIHVEPN